MLERHVFVASVQKYEYPRRDDPLPPSPINEWGSETFPNLEEKGVGEIAGLQVRSRAQAEQRSSGEWPMSAGPKSPSFSPTAHQRSPSTPGPPFLQPLKTPVGTWSTLAPALPTNRLEGEDHPLRPRDHLFKHRPQRTRPSRQLSILAHPPALPASCPASRQAPVKANAFQGNSGSGSHLAGPQKLYLESRRGPDEAHWQLQGRTGIPVRHSQGKPKNPSPKPGFPSRLPAPSCFQRLRKADRLRLHFTFCHLAISSFSRYFPPYDSQRECIHIPLG